MCVRALSMHVCTQVHVRACVCVCVCVCLSWLLSGTYSCTCPPEPALPPVSEELGSVLTLTRFLMFEQLLCLLLPWCLPLTLFASLFRNYSAIPYCLWIKSKLHCLPFEAVPSQPVLSPTPPMRKWPVFQPCGMVYYFLGNVGLTGSPP